MNDQMLNEGLLAERMMQQAMWLEWLQPFLYCLLAIAVVSLVIVLLDLAMLCWKEFHPADMQVTTKARTETAPVREATSTSIAVVKTQSYDAIKVLFLLLCVCQFSPVAFAQDQSTALNTAIRDGELKQVKTLLAQGVNINAQDADGTTPLMHAVVNAEADCVKLLLDQGADPNLSNKAGA
ncbi:MAG TPA: ankyrin repeat domain-containing protein, partial [Blastocatellia bacterium]|nr:ankyrin repeat domain-containing protein [Blastocatellia bacterium]